jgi:macrolide transport system ATP-binding/permease protein
MCSILSVPGIANLIAMFAIVNGSKRDIAKEIANLGRTDILIVVSGFSQNDIFINLNISDIDDLKMTVSGIRTVSGSCMRNELNIVANGKH